MTYDYPNPAELALQFDELKLRQARKCWKRRNEWWKEAGMTYGDWWTKSFGGGETLEQYGMRKAAERNKAES